MAVSTEILSRYFYSLRVGILAYTNDLVKYEESDMEDVLMDEPSFQKKNTEVSQFSLSTKSVSTTRVNFEDFETSWKNQLLENAQKAFEYEAIMKQAITDYQIENNALSGVCPNFEQFNTISMLPFYCEYDTREKCRANSKQVFKFCK